MLIISTVIFILHVAATLLPSAVVTVIFASPAPTAVTTPFATVATAGLLLCHVTLLLVVFSGSTVAVKVKLSPTFKFAVVWLRLTLCACTVVVSPPPDMLPPFPVIVSG